MCRSYMGGPVQFKLMLFQSQLPPHNSYLVGSGSQTHIKYAAFLQCLKTALTSTTLTCIFPSHTLQIWWGEKCSPKSRVLTQTQVLYRMLKQSLDISSLTASKWIITGYFFIKDSIPILHFFENKNYSS